jgi:DNA-binding NarL/FixJ family response regulator
LPRRCPRPSPRRSASSSADRCTAARQTTPGGQAVAVRAGGLSGPATLTASERRVAELAAAGLSNRDIAQSLFVTAKTVEVHLTSTYQKLKVTGRNNLATVLAE